ncbi:hypothetical protein [Bdellovibrio sp. HCB337]|uniref:hypothetical protein n=1 Tax=Bdellovibrio sp. HCB337 TaxID=3394358 RepID=UPI0039A403C3
MAWVFASEKQKALFGLLEKCGELIYGGGPKGAVANLVGEFTVRRNHHGDDQLDVGDGTCHVHIDWSQVKRVEVSDYHGEGMLSFFNEKDCLFKLYRMSGPWPKEVEAFAAVSLLD